MTNPLDKTNHRPWELPKPPWVMKQSWNELLFAHWKLEPNVMAPHIPDGLELDLYEGQAWLSVVPFMMYDIHPRFLPAVPWLSTFAELNVRTYVKRDGKTGVLFFSLDAENPVGVFLGRNWFNLPYFNADFSIKRQGDRFDYRCVRTHKNAPQGELDVSYRPTSGKFTADPNTLEHFLTERYCLYAENNEKIYRAEVHHHPWEIQECELEIRKNSITSFELSDQPDIAHYTDGVDVVVWNLKRIK